jgi:hypothetical protein
MPSPRVDYYLLALRWFTWFVVLTFAMVDLLGLRLLWKIWRSD